MKKTIALTLTLALVLSLTACGKGTDGGSTGSADTQSESVTATEEPAAEISETEDGAGESDDAAATEEPAAEVSDSEGDTNGKSEGVMTYAEYDAAELDSEVVIETYVQAKQSWWEDKATLYTQDKDGAYFIYSAVCPEADYDKLTPGTKIKVTGYKTEWSGEVEVAEGATIEILDGSYTAPATDVTDLLGKDDELIKHQNKFVSFKGMTVETYEKDGESYDCAVVYNDDNSGSAADNSDLYFNVSKDGQTYTFCVESYLCDSSTDVYKAVENLQVGDTVDLEGFLYWYNGANPHITSVTVK